MAVSSSSPQRLSDSGAEPDDLGSDDQAALAPNEYEGLSAQPGPVSVSDDQQLATLTHMLGVVGCVPSMIIHRWARGRARFTEQESLEAANFTLLPTLVVIAGALLAVGCCEPESSGAPVLAGITVVPAARGLGLGRAVTADLTRVAVAEHGWCTLGMYSHNARARGVYRSLGYVVQAEWSSGRLA